MQNIEFDPEKRKTIKKRIPILMGSIIFNVKINSKEAQDTSIFSRVSINLENGITIQNPMNGYEFQMPAGINDTNPDGITRLEKTLNVTSDENITSSTR